MNSDATDLVFVVIDRDDVDPGTGRVDVHAVIRPDFLQEAIDADRFAAVAVVIAWTLLDGALESARPGLSRALRAAMDALAPTMPWARDEG